MDMSVMAMVPKAKKMCAQRLTLEEYRALMRRRSVLEVVIMLQNHPYFTQTLSGLAQTNPHREQIEQALSRDLFYKYEQLMRYCLNKNDVSHYFVVRSEINEILHKLRLISVGYPDRYISQMPGFLVSRTKINLMQMAQANNMQDMLKIFCKTKYADAIRKIMPKQGENLDYLKCENVFETFYYKYAISKIDEKMNKTDAKQTKELFCTMAEIYNIDLIIRAKAFYKKELNSEKIQQLLLPIYGTLTKSKLFKLAKANDINELITLYNQSKAANFYGSMPLNYSDIIGVKPYKTLRKKALKLIHFSINAQTVLAALLCLADIEKSNLITVVEGVRYNLPPEKIERFLKM